MNKLNLDKYIKDSTNYKMKMLMGESKVSTKFTNINAETDNKMTIDHQKSEHTLGVQKSKYI